MHGETVKKSTKIHQILRRLYVCACVYDKFCNQAGLLVGPKLPFHSCVPAGSSMSEYHWLQLLSRHPHFQNIIWQVGRLISVCKSKISLPVHKSATVNKHQSGTWKLWKSYPAFINICHKLSLIQSDINPTWCKSFKTRHTICFSPHSFIYINQITAQVLQFMFLKLGVSQPRSEARNGQSQMSALHVKFSNMFRTWVFPNKSQAHKSIQWPWPISVTSLR